MPEIREVKKQQMDQRCPNCGDGYMRPNGIVNPGPPASFEHRCNVCGAKSFYNVRYPYIVDN